MMSFLFFLLLFLFFLSSSLPSFLSFALRGDGRRKRKEEEEWDSEDADGRKVFIASFFSALGADGREGGMMMLGWRVNGEAIP